MDNPLPLVLVIVAVAFAGWLSQRSRKKMDEYRKQLEEHGEYVAPQPKQRLTRAQRRVEEFRSSVPPPPKQSIEDIARAEAEDLGLADIPGAAGLPVNVQLLVWRRDGDIRERCEGTIRYTVTDGVSAETATPDDVSLACDGQLRPIDPEDGNKQDP